MGGENNASRRVQASRRGTDLVADRAEGVIQVGAISTSDQVHFQPSKSFGHAERFLTSDKGQVNGVSRNRITRAEVRRHPLS